jgi:hypothetical protein
LSRSFCATDSAELLSMRIVSLLLQTQTIVWQQM